MKNKIISSSLFSNQWEYLYELAAVIVPCIIILIGFWILGEFCYYIINNITKSKKLNPTIIKLLARAVKKIVLIIGIIYALASLGIDVSAIIAGLGWTGFALGFALKDILSNFISGILILLYNTFKVGDYIQIDKYEGTVVDITLRYTTIKKDGKDILVPNSFLFSKPISISLESNNE